MYVYVLISFFSVHMSREKLHLPVDDLLKLFNATRIFASLRSAYRDNSS